MKTKLQKTIMRRVYYSYAIRFATDPMLWQGFVLGACIALFGRLTHVAAIAHNFSATKIENAPAFVYNSFTHALNNGEVLTALITLFIVGLSVKFFFRAVPLLLSLRKYQTV